jgi:hypothetical protein
MLAKVLNLHPDIAVTGEYPLSMLADTFALIRRVEAHLERLSNTALDHWHREKFGRWQYRRAAILLQAWKAVSTKSIATKACRCSVIGNKTPGAEFYFEDFDWLFSSRVKYIYCLREGAKVLRSLKNMPWNKKSFRKNLERYKRSVQAAEAFKKKSPNRIIFCQIDKEQPQGGGLESIGTRVFDFLGREMTPVIAEKLRTLEPAQPMTAPKFDIKRIDELTKHEVKKLASDKEYMRISRAYGYANKTTGTR